MYMNPVERQELLHWDVILWIVGACLSACVVALLRRTATLDVPSGRSMHSTPTPRGGGLGIVCAFYACAILWMYYTKFSGGPLMALLEGGFPIALIGLIDDRSHVPPAARAIVHIVGCLLALSALLLEYHRIDGVDLGLLAVLLAITIGAAYFVNIFNFMDGLDGLAASEAVIATAVMGWILWGRQSFIDAGLESDQTRFGVVLLGMCTLGFLVWNWPPAKIFMGDVGSGFLGFALAFYALYPVLFRPNLTWAWVILLGVFVVDGSYTLLVRFASGQKWYEAHNLHAFQKAAKQSSHATVTKAVIAINLLWLAPLADYAAHNYRSGWWLTLIAYTPLLIAAQKFQAGVIEPPPPAEPSVAQ